MEKCRSMRDFELKNRRYLGSKRLVLPAIMAVCDGLHYRPRTAVDIFAGTGMVGQELMRAGFHVTFNDLLHSNVAIYNAFFGDEKVDLQSLSDVVDSVNRIADPEKLPPNYFSETFGGTYFSTKNARLIGHLRELAERFTGRSRDILIASAIYGADKVAHTVGHYDAFRAGAEGSSRVTFGVPRLETLRGRATIHCASANNLAREGSWDIAYLDPPYNSRQYGDMYHVLENLTDWKKPPVHFKAKKMDRRHLRSEYSTKSASAALADLVNSLQAKTIILSYNDTGVRGNARSAAKISDQEITEILSDKGDLEIREIDHKPFTTGKSQIGGISERLFVCHVDRPTRRSHHFVSPPEKERGIAVSPLNYVGNKKKLMPQLRSIFDMHPGNPERFVDLFCGGMTVGLNSGFSEVLLNDINPDVINLARVFRDWEYGKVLSAVEGLIETFGLSNSSLLGYEAYGANSSNGLGSYNKENYYRLRDYLDTQELGTDARAIAFFTATIFSFNNQIRFNSAGRFNMPVGKRDFNARVKNNLFSTMTRLQSIRAELSNKDFREVLGSASPKDFVYCDPPYILGLAPYNEQNAWTVRDETSLLEALADISRRGISFALSNVIQNKGERHPLLEEWARDEGFKLHILNQSYANSSYHRKACGPSIEVLITNSSGP